MYNHVQYLQKKNFQQGIDDFQEKSTSTWVNTVSSDASGPSKRFCWSKEDENKILEAFAMFQTCPPKKTSYLKVKKKTAEMKTTSSVCTTSLKIAVKYKGLRDEIEDKSTLASARQKRSQADESDDDVVPPTPPKRKAAKNSQSVSVPAAEDEDHK